MRKKTVLSDQVVVRLPTDLREAILVAAEEDRRSSSSLIRNVLADWLKGRSPTAHAA
jgi:hypothetical protein